MDRKLSKEEINKRRYKKGGKIVATAVIVISAGSLILSLLAPTIKKSDLIFATVDTGSIETSITTYGKIVPAFEEVINAPITSRILEVYCKAGDSIKEGMPLLKLDLQTTENSYKKLLDEEKMKQYSYEQFMVNSKTKLSNMRMQLKIAEMKLQRMHAELQNEYYMDSIGAQTTDNVRQAELNYRVAKIEFEQQKLQFENEKEVIAAEEKVQKLSLNIFEKNVEEMKRKYENAQVRAPREATLTFIKTQIGELVSEGSELAILSDLTTFKVEGSIDETYANMLKPGGKVIAKVNRQMLEGSISNIAPKSDNSIISFNVTLKNDSSNVLRPGIRCDLYIINMVKENVVRIKNGSFYNGNGEYRLFVEHDDGKIAQRRVILGESNYDYVEVVDGLKPDERVVMNDMSPYLDKSVIKLK